MQPGRQARLMELLGWRKKGMEKRLVPQSFLGGFTTRWVVDFSLLLVRRCNISPTFTTICSGREVTGTHSSCLDNISSPSADAPMSRVMRLISSCCSARMAERGSLVMGG